MKMKLSISERLMHSTVRIELLNSKEEVQGTGTGFFFEYDMENDNKILVLVTNKHVIQNEKFGRLTFTISSERKNPKYGDLFTYIIENFEDSFILHPDDNVDLCIMPMQPIIDQVRLMYDKTLFMVFLNETLIPSKQQIKNLSALEDVIMIGYPNGLWDQANNLPIIRRGMTAIHPKFNYNHKSDIVVDIAAFPGSSGSPIGIYNHGTYVTGNDVNVGSRFFLLGILYAGPSQSILGEINTVTIPTSATSFVTSSVMINLGYAVKSRRLIDFKEMLINLINGIK